MALEDSDLVDKLRFVVLPSIPFRPHILGLLRLSFRLVPEPQRRCQVYRTFPKAAAPDQDVEFGEQGFDGLPELASVHEEQGERTTCG